MVTQVEVARQVGLDVSTVNKILNRVPGPVFRKETIKSVFVKARELGYDMRRRGKGEMRRTLCELFPNISPVELGTARGVPVNEVIRIQKMLYGKA